MAWNVQAQQRPVFTMYMDNTLSINPAYAGNQRQLSVTGVIRNQWVNFPGAPKTQMLTVHGPFRKYPVGVGLAITRETIGVHEDYSVYSAYAYQIKLKKGMISLGLQGGFNWLLSDFSKLRAQDGTDKSLTHYRSFNPNFGTGIFYSTNTGYLGFSVPYLVNNRVFNQVRENGTESLSSEKRYYILMAGKVLDMSEAVKIKPSAILRYQEGAPFNFDISMNFFLEDVLNVGVGYRSIDAISAMFKLDLNENFSFGYSYDYILSGLSAYTQGTHEVLVNYRIKLSSTPCHTYF